ncbi:MAG: GIN domain-containing protein [Caulobacteraceae bacterium]
MRKSIIAVAAGFGLAALTGATTASAAELFLKDVIADVRIIPEARSDISVRILQNPAKLPQPVVSRTAQGVVVDGRIPNRRNTHGCRMFKGGARNNRTQIEVRAPLDFAVRATGSVDGSVGSARALSLATEGCGNWRLQDATRLSLRMEGFGNVDGGRAGATSIHIEGMGHANLQSVSGPLDVAVEGFGGAHIAGGRVSRMTAELDGMGSIKFDGVADSLNANASGVGNIYVARVLGPVRKNRDGIARIKVGRQG